MPLLGMQDAGIPCVATLLDPVSIGLSIAYFIKII
jgi:hypothetical protein